ncbi:MAG: biotin--[acetyl-CoA-carboxylase] ligase [Hyphomicrobiales bacterium]|nr:biotin--[acetyl-CoA-carboxylase] ligase [Hyphomicrobiales bacterium]
MHLGPHAARQNYRLETFETLGSTNEEALSRARAGERGPLWIVAAEQTQGRGRRGRSWTSPRGNLYASLLLSEPCAPERAPELGFVAGVALAEAVRARVGAAPGLGLKWPNDLLHDGAKLSGMLLEATRAPGGPLAVVIGIGVNCMSHPDDVAYSTTDLDAIRSGAGDVAPLFAELSDALARALERWRAGADFAAIRKQWLAACLGRGQTIRVSNAGAIVEGVFETIDETGRLILAAPGGRMTIEAGDVLLSGASAGAVRDSA